MRALHVLLTGKEPEDAPIEGDPWMPCVVPSLAGLNVVFGFDRIQKTEIPDSAYPYVLIEPGAASPTERDYQRRVTVYFDIGVRQSGILGVLFGKTGIMDYADRLEGWIRDNQVLRVLGQVNATAATVTRLELSAKGGSGQRSAKRYATLTVDYTIRREYSNVQ